MTEVTLDLVGPSIQGLGLKEGIFLGPPEEERCGVPTAPEHNTRGLALGGQIIESPAQPEREDLPTVTCTRVVSPLPTCAKEATHNSVGSTYSPHCLTKSADHKCHLDSLTVHSPFIREGITLPLNNTMLGGKECIQLQGPQHKKNMKPCPRLQCFDSGEAIGVASMRRCQTLPPCLTETMPGSSKADPLLAKAKPISTLGAPLRQSIHESKYWATSVGQRSENMHRFPDPLYYYPPQILHIDSVILLLMIPIGILQRPLGVC
ncbi:hypothetical protein DUI87_11143 [Hirundo rustica rustica]|uniref:Uncharacterized protein n=1 Tax=Hirundo rustica rustica TaxID=333673 RepID=A0A3M0KM19_HIRRU|nr:hypothetical protein DUI87_11143 [Hirundo rustica rustica]